MYELLIAAVVIVLLLCAYYYYYYVLHGLTAGMKEGDAVKCVGNDAIFKIENGKKRWIKTPAAFAKAKLPPVILVPCESLKMLLDGPNID